MNEMDLDKFYQLLSRKMAGQATEAELAELFSMIEDNKDLFALYQQLSAPLVADWNEVDAEADASFAVHTIKMQMQAEQPAMVPVPEENRIRRFSRPLTWLAVAASVAALWFGTTYFSEGTVSKPQATTKPNEIVTKKGSRSTIQLPDGSKVSLNADSKLTYKDDFSGKTREVTLIGEAFFDIKRDSLKPFIIHTEKINIRVLGTSFNVKSYPQDEIIETSLIHGKIEVTYTDRPSEKVVLHPNEKLSIRKDQGTANVSGQSFPKIQLNNIVVMKDSLISETAWMENKLVFSNEMLEGIARNLERQFNVTIEFKNEEPKQYTYTGLFEHESIEKILGVLSLSQPFRYVMNGSRITIEK